MKNINIISVLCLALSFGVNPDNSLELTPEQKKQIEALTKDVLMAPDFELNSVDNKKYKLSDLRGKVVILNFWATWCSPCRMEIPDFNELYLKHKDEGLIILGVSTDDTKVGLLNFLKTYKIEYPVLYGSSRQIAEISNKYGGIRALPTSVIIDRNGEVKRKYPTAILKNHTPQVYSSFNYDVEVALKSKVNLKEEPSK